MPTFSSIVRVCTALLTLVAAGAAARPGPAPSAPPDGGFRWRNIGPAVGGGRTTAIAIAPSDPARFYLATAGGGVWRSDDAGIAWRPVFDGESTGSVGAVTVSPTDPDDVWVGTGEAWPRNDVIAGDGVYHTTDGGATWQHLGLVRTSQIARIVVDPRDPRKILVAALGSPFADSDDRGVYRSDDGGASWQRTLFLGRQTGASDLAVDPAHPDVVYAGMWQFRRNAWHLTSGGSADGIYKSLDGGRTWRALTGNGLPPGMMGRIGLAVAPSRPKRVYAIVESAAGILWRSDDAGEHWTLVSRNTLIDERPFYYSRVIVDPKNPDHLFAVSVRLAESLDGGKAWHPLGTATHGDHHDVAFSPDGHTIVDADDGGPAVSRDGGKTWDWRRTLTTAQVYHLGFDRRTPYSVCAGLQDNGTWCGPSDSGDPAGILARDWTRVDGGDGTWVLPDPVDPSIVFSASGGGDNGGALARFSRTALHGVDVSPYLRDQNVVAPYDLRYRFNWESPLAFSPFERDTLYMGADVVFRSTDRGATWRPISPDLTRNLRERQGLSGTPLRLDVTGAETFDTILSIAPSPLSPATMWVGTDDGKVQLTRDGGTTWVDVSPPDLDADARVTSVEPSHAYAARAYITVDRHFTGDVRPIVERTDDGGAHWRTVTAGLPETAFAHVVREDPHDPDLLFAGTERGVWMSRDGGTAWTEFPAKLPPVSVHDLAIQPDAGDLIAGTHGRGIWIFDDLRALEARAPADVQLFAPRDAVRIEHATATNPDPVRGANPAAAALITFFQKTAANAPPSIEIRDAGGRLVRRLDGTAANAQTPPAVPNVAGFNRVAWHLDEDPPTPWRRAPAWNRGPSQGAPVVPGTYTVTLVRDGQQQRTTLHVAATPAAREDALRTEAFIRELDTQLSHIDDALNVLDNVRLQLPERAHDARVVLDPATGARLAQAAAKATSVERELTSSPDNSQDDDFLTDVVRERLMTLRESWLGAPPTAEARREASAIEQDARTALDHYAAFIQEMTPVTSALASAGAPLDPAERPAPDAKPDPDVDERGDRRDPDH